MTNLQAIAVSLLAFAVAFAIAIATKIDLADRRLWKLENVLKTQELFRPSN